MFCRAAVTTTSPTDLCHAQSRQPVNSLLIALQFPIHTAIMTHCQLLMLDKWVVGSKQCCQLIRQASLIATPLLSNNTLITKETMIRRATSIMIDNSAIKVPRSWVRNTAASDGRRTPSSNSTSASVTTSGRSGASRRWRADSSTSSSCAITTRTTAARRRTSSRAT